MKFTNEFENIYQELLNYYKNGFGRKRKKINIIMVIISSVLLITLLYYLNFNKVSSTTTSRLAALCFLIIVLNIIINNKFKKIYKKEIIERLVTRVNSSFKLQDNEYLREEYIDAGFIDGAYLYIDVPFIYPGDIHTQIEDYFVGNIGENEFLAFGGVMVELNTRTTTKSRFKGVFSSLKYNNDIISEMTIGYNQLLEGNSELTEDCANNLLEICKRYEIKPEIKIAPNRAYLRVYSKDIFEPGMFPMNKRKIFNYYNVIKFINEVMTEIKNATEV